MPSTATGAPRHRHTSEGQTGLEIGAAGSDAKQVFNVNDESYRLVRTTVRSVLGSFPCRERLQPPSPDQRDPVKQPAGSISFISRRKLGQWWRVPWRTVSTRLCGPVFAERLVGKTPPRSNGEREFHPNGLTHSAPDLQKLMRNLHTCLLCAVQPG